MTTIKQIQRELMKSYKELTKALTPLVHECVTVATDIRHNPYLTKQEKKSALMSWASYRYDVDWEKELKKKRK